MGFLKNLFGGKKKNELPPSEFTDEEFEKDYELKSQGLEEVLGKSYEYVGHAIIPFAVGGAVDMYYYPNHIPGTGFVTMELLDPKGKGPKPNRLGTYELIAFTKETIETDREAESRFNKIERRFCGIFTTIGWFSTEAILNPKETCEVPKEGEDNRCLIFDLYKEFKVGDRQHHLLLCLEVFRSEMEYAMQNGSEDLINMLRAAGHYPYSDLNRTPVV
jgi:hypothetical protein